MLSYAKIIPDITVYLYDFANRKMDCRISIETVNSDSFVIAKRYAQFYFSWVFPEEIKEPIRKSEKSLCF